LAKIKRCEWFGGRGFGWLAQLGATMALGRRGERAAERHLRRCGYRIVARNFRAAGAEIDLIAMDGDTLVFVEMKTRSSASAGAPVDALIGASRSACATPQRRLPRAIAQATG
jgi:hypothetical protein